MTASARRLLMIDDDAMLARLLQTVLVLDGFEVAWADRPSKGLPMLAERPDLILLDVMMPEMDGFEVCRRIRASGDATPILMLTGRGGADDRVRGLEIGADDYLAKPFDHPELVARINALLRRKPPVGGRLDRERKTLRLADREIPLTAMEYRLLVVLCAAPGRVFSRGELIEAIDAAGAIESFDRAIDSHVSRLRAKIEADPRNPRHLDTVRGMGYRFSW